jgi:hypothetical protein
VAVPAPLSVPDGQTTAQEPKHYGVSVDLSATEAVDLRSGAQENLAGLCCVLY